MKMNAAEIKKSLRENQAKAERKPKNRIEARGWGMNSNFTSWANEGDRIVVNYWYAGEFVARIGTVEKVWKNGIVVANVPQLQVMNTRGKIVPKYPERVLKADPQKIKFNPDGRGRGDQSRFSMRYIDPEVETAETIDEENARFNWDKMIEEALLQDEQKEKARERENDFQKKWDEAQRINAKNKRNKKVTITPVGKVHQMDIIRKDGSFGVVLMTIEKTETEYTKKIVHYANVAFLHQDSWVSSGRVQWAHQNMIKANSLQELIDSIVYTFWNY